MASEVKTNKVSPVGTTLSVGDSGDTLALSTDAVTGFQVGSDIQGDVLYHDGTDYTRLGAGTSGYFLKTQGTSSDPVWAEAGGNTVFISKQTASDDASLAFTSGFSTDYFEYIFKFDNLKPATDTVDILMYLSDDAGSSYFSAGFYTVSWFTSRTSGGAVSSDILAKEVWNGAFAYMSWNQGNNAGTEYRSAGELRLYRADASAATTWTSTQVQFEADDKFSRQFTAGSVDAAVVNGIKFAFSSGNITSGDIYMYGVKAE